MEKQIFPRATKTSLVKLLRAKGYDVPSSRQAYFDKLGRGNAITYVLEWVDSQKRRQRAFYSGCAGRPYLSVGKEWTWLTMAEVIQFGLYKDKKIPHDCEGSHTGSVLKEYNKDIFILAQENEFGKGVAEKT